MTDQTITLQLELVELEEQNYHILLEGRLADGTTGWWVVDTGASRTVLDKNLSNCYQLIRTSGPENYQSAGITEGLINTELGVTPELQFGELIIRNLSVALLNLDHVNEIYSKYANRRIAGLLGSDVLYAHRAVIDYPNCRMLVVP